MPPVAPAGRPPHAPEAHVRTGRIRSLAAVAAVITMGLASAGTAHAAPSAATVPGPDRALPADTRFLVDPQSKAARQALAFARAGELREAALMVKLASWPIATWFTGGTPDTVRRDVAREVAKGRLFGRVPVLVAYNVPGRDCSQYSSGGAEGTAAYRAWIDGFAAGLGERRAVVILEPDGLALSPDQCGGTAEQQADRNAQMTYAVARLTRQPGATVYLDAGHSAWHNVGDMAQRLITGGVQDARGFFLNVSNYRTDADLVRFGTMVSSCVWYLRNTPGAVDTDCANQYWPAADADAWYAAHVPADAVLPRFVIDSSRNGRGPWTPPAGVYSDPQDWCNPPGRGVGVRPTADTRTPLLDAFLWVKVPGESDGSCTRGTAGPTDPEYGVVDPAAGVWWPEQAVGLAERAVPPLTLNRRAFG